MKQTEGHISRAKLAEATGLSEGEVQTIARHYNIHRDEGGNIHFENFIKHAFRFTKENCLLGELTEMFGVTEREINKLANLGKLPKTERGIYPRVKAVQAYIQLLRLQLERRGSDTYEEAELREMIAKADLREIQAAREKKQIITIDDAYHAMQTAVTVTRQRILNVSKEAIAHLDTIATPALREDALKKMLHEALTETSALPSKLKELASHREPSTVTPEPEQPTPTRLTSSGVGTGTKKIRKRKSSIKNPK